MSPLSKLLRAAVTLALALAFGPRLAEAQKALVYCPVSIDATGCATIKSALTGAFPGGIDSGYDGTQGSVDLKTVDLFQYSVVLVPSLAESDSAAPYAVLRDPAVASRLKLALLGRRAFWSGTPDQGVVSATRPQKDALIQNLAAWAGADFATVNAPGLVVLQDNSEDVTKRYDWVQAITGFSLIADARFASYSAVTSLTAAGNAVLSSNGSTLAYGNMASMGFQTPSGAPGTSMDAVGKTGTSVGGQVVLITQSGANTGGAVITTDKDDYAPYTTVVMTGSGFGASETVTLLLHEDPTVDSDVTLTTTADANGGFVFSGFAPDSHDIDVRFVLTATGSSSGRQAQTTFTDGNVTAVSNTVTRNATGVSNSTTACAATTPGSFVLNGVYCGQTQVSTISGGGTTQIFLRWLTPSNAVACSADINVAVNGTYSLNCQLNAAGNWVFRVCTNQNCTGAGNILQSVNAVVAGTQNQSISFTAPVGVTYGDADVTLGASASSGLTVTYVSSTPTVCTIVSGKLHVVAAGSCTVTASQIGNASFNPAADVAQIFSIGARAVTVTADPQSVMYGDADPTLTYSLTTGTLVGSDAFSGTLARAAGTGVGNYAITQGSLSLGTNYALSFIGANLTVTSRLITVTANAATKGYGDVDPALTYSVTTGTLFGTDAFSGALTRTAGEAVNTYAITQGSLAVNSNYSITFAGANLTITPKAITVTADAKSKVYGAADPVLTFAAASGSLVGSDQLSGTPSRVAGENVGTYAIQQGSVSGGGNYTINFVSADLTISQKALTITADAKTKVYGNADPALTYQLTSGSLISGDSFSGSLTRAPGEDVGAYAILQGGVSAGGNYAITFTGANLDITTRAISVKADAQTKVYGDADPGFTYQITSGSLAFSDVFTGALARAAGENVGTHAINVGSLTPGSNYTVSFTSADLTITPRAITVTADPKSKVYGDADPTLTYQITSGSLAFTDVFSGALARGGTQNVGSHPIGQGTLDLSTNYVLSYIGASLSITPRPITVTADGKTKVYGDADPSLTAQVTTGNLAYSDQLSGSPTRAPGEIVGSYAIGQGTVSAGGNYTLTFVDGSLGITPRPITVTADAQSKVYGNADPALTYQLSSALVFSDVFAGSLTRASGEDVGPYAIGQGSLVLSTNYALTFVGATLTISPRPVTVMADAQTKIYGDADPAFTYQVSAGNLVNGDVLSGALTRVAGENVGPYAIQQGTLALSTNYTLTYAGASLTITPRAVTVAADAKTKIYGNADPALTYQISAGNLVNGDVFSGALTRVTGENVGPYAIQQGTLALSTNYTLGFTGANLTVSARPITVTADAKTKVYGDPDPALTAQVTTGSLAFSDVLSGALSRAPGVNVASYAIAQNALTAGANYILTYVGANLVITPRPITLQPVAPDLIWTGSPLTPAYSLGIASGTVGHGDPLTVFVGASYSPMSVTPVGTYHPTLTGALNANYTVSYATGTFAVLDQTKPTGAITELLPIPLGGSPIVKVNFTDVTTGNSNIVEWQYRLDNTPYGAATIPVSPQSSNVNVQSNVVVPTNATDVVKVCVQGKDAGGNWSPETCALLAIYDPSAGFVTGGGWINSPAGAYTPNPSLMGKANFGFVSKYKKGANVPTGNTEFQFQEGNLNFSSTSFQWLVIQGTTMSQFKGVGTINGQGSYNFMVTAIDGDNFSGTKKSDSFRMKIMSGSTVIYDNQMNADEASASATALGGGSIQIHDK